MADFDWDAEAIAIANYVKEHMHDAHRGASTSRQLEVAVLFGNDGYQDERTKLELLRLRDILDFFGVNVLGFGVDTSEAYTWVMLVEPTEEFDVATLNSLVWATAKVSGFDNAIEQAVVAWPVIDQHRRRPDHSAN